MGNGIFAGNETVYFKKNPVWAMSYYGNFKGMSEKEIDTILRNALLENWQEARIWKKVKWEKGKYKYLCKPNPKSSIEELAGTEKIFKNKKEIYQFFYAGGLIG